LLLLAMMHTDDEAPSIEALQFTARRAKGVAVTLSAVLQNCNVLPR
jgi:hypothetical protein